MLSERFEMYGKGRPRPITSGVSAGNTWLWNRCSTCWRSESSASARAMMRIPCSASAGLISSSKHRLSRPRRPMTRSRITSITWAAAIPSAPRPSVLFST